MNASPFSRDHADDTDGSHQTPDHATDVFVKPTVVSLQSVGSTPASKSEVNPVGVVSFLDGSIQVDLRAENVEHFIGAGAGFKGGQITFPAGAIIDGQVEADTLCVKGTLIVKPNARISSGIVCDRLINFGEIDSAAAVVVHGLMVGWAGQIKARSGFYAQSFEITDKCVLRGESKALDELVGAK